MARQPEPGPERGWPVEDQTNVLILGVTGQVGTELMRQAWPARIKVHAPRRCELDLANEGAIDELVASRRWACVINAAAYTAVDNAETEVGSAWRINALAPALLAAGTARTRTPIIHVSTDYVFDGEIREAIPARGSGAAEERIWSEQGRRRACGAYGQSAPCHRTHVLGLQSASIEFRQDDAPPCRRARGIARRGRSIRMSDLCRRSCGRPHEHLPAPG